MANDSMSRTERTMETCSRCSTWVLRKADGTCPACGKPVQGDVPSATQSTAASNPSAQKESNAPFQSEYQRQLQKKIDIIFGSAVVVVATIGMGVVGYIISEERWIFGFLASFLTLGLLSLGIFCASKKRFLPAFGIVSAFVFVWALFVLLTQGETWSLYFLAFCAEIAFFTGGRIYEAMIAKWAPRE